MTALLRGVVVAINSVIARLLTPAQRLVLPRLSAGGTGHDQLPGLVFRDPLPLTIQTGSNCSLPPATQLELAR
jgi:hypothetical protein